MRLNEIVRLFIISDNHTLVKILCGKQCCKLSFSVEKFVRAAFPQLLDSFVDSLITKDHKQCHLFNLGFVLLKERQIFEAILELPKKPIKSIIVDILPKKSRHIKASFIKQKIYNRNLIPYKLIPSSQLPQAIVNIFVLIT